MMDYVVDQVTAQSLGRGPDERRVEPLCLRARRPCCLGGRAHSNTVRQRLERFEQTTGQSPRETATLVELYWALEHRRIG
jgi:hypothetical protein